MKGFTFSQLAAILLVVLGLTVAIVIAATQLSSAGSKISEIGGQVDTKNVDISLGLECLSKGGFCVTLSAGQTTCSNVDANYVDLDVDTTTGGYQHDCGSGKRCCTR